SDQRRSIAHSHDPQSNPSPKLAHVVRRVARELMVLQMTPHPLVGVQLGAVAREAVDLEARMSLEELANHCRAVVRSVVPKDHDRPSPDMAEEVAEERDDLGTPDRVLVNAEVEAARGGHPTDCRELRPPSLVEKHGGLPDRCPGLRGVRDQREAALVCEDHYGSSAAGFFL